ncbi:MAG: response regulator transcription factor [Anaerolineaceae bacterium]|jgi:DNA-binding NarL/FixJ family response regulator
MEMEDVVINLFFVIQEKSRWRQAVPRFLFEMYGTKQVKIDFSESFEKVVEKMQGVTPDILILELALIKPNQWVNVQKLTQHTSVIGFYESSAPIGPSDSGGNVLKACVSEEELYPTLVQSITSIVDGKAGSQSNLLGTDTEITQSSKNLTKREIEALKLAAQGFKNKEIAEVLCLSQRTVRYHLERIYQKLNVHNKAEAIMKAVHQGLIQ